MRYQYIKKMKKKSIRKGVLDLLTICDNEFVPPLSQRKSTTQMNLTNTSNREKVPIDYFNIVQTQPAIVVFDGKKVVGFMTFCKNYICGDIDPKLSPNVYITTVVVRPEYRNMGITNRLYNKLQELFVGYHIFTRTWSTNQSHTRILHAHKFYEYYRKQNDRGEGIDTVYYHYPPYKKTWFQIFKQYRLTGNIFFFLLLLFLTFVFVFLWIYTKKGLLHELSIAFSTSLLASVLCLLSDTVLKYRDSKNDEYINELKKYGIERFLFHKDELLELLIPKCTQEIWISGYRLIMTSKKTFLEAIKKACERAEKLSIRLLVVAPWSNTFHLVYGNEDVTNNYFNVLMCLCNNMKDNNIMLEIRFTEKPIFNDTYKVDNRFITSPYLNCADKLSNRITAKDFFSFDITDSKKELYDIIEKDYLVVWDETDLTLDTSKFLATCTNKDFSEMSYVEKINILQGCCKPVNMILATTNKVG